MTLGDAIERYHEILTPEVAAASWAALETAMRAERLAFGQRPICTVLRPYFLARGEAEALASATRRVVSAIHSTFARIGADEYEAKLGLSPAEAALARIDVGFEPAEAIARLDSFWPRGGSLKFIEYNSESPGGIGFGAALARIFRTLPVMQAFERQFEISSEPVLDHTLHALVGAYRAWGGTAPKPAIAIVDRREAPTYTEFVLCREAFEAHGHVAVIADPSELELSRGRLFAREIPVDIVYRRIIASDVAAHLPLGHPLVRAAAERAACVASGFRAFALLSKALFALVSDPATSAHLTPDERANVDAHIPWTRIVRDGRTTNWLGEEVDLLEFVAAHRDRLVVKPATDYGGAGVHLGWTETDEEWARAIEDALVRPSVVQHRVEIPSEPYPVFSEGSLRFVSFMADIDPYVFGGSAGMGQGTRLSASQLLNVTAGGGSAAPVFVVSPRNA